MFERDVNDHLKKGWRVVPTTLQVAINASGGTMVCMVVVEKPLS